LRGALPSRVSFGARVALRVILDIVLVLIAFAVTALLLLPLLDWLCDGRCTTVREWLTTLSPRSDL